MWGMEIKLPIILTLTVAGDNWSVFHFGCLYLTPTKEEAQCDRDYSSCYQESYTQSNTLLSYYGKQL